MGEPTAEIMIVPTFIVDQLICAAFVLWSGPPPIFVGFGSLVIKHPEKLTKRFIKALKATGQRGILQVWKDWEDILTSLQHAVSFLPTISLHP